MQEQEERTIGLREILIIFRKRLGLILLSTLIVTALGTIYTLFIATPTYTASTQLVAKITDSDVSGAYAGQVTGNIQMANTISQVIVSQAILDKVKTDLKLSNNLSNYVTASNTPNSQVINITVEYDDPYLAQKIADETAQVFSDNAKRILNVTNVSILSYATVEKKPIKPKPILNIAISVLIGLIIGVGLALLREAFNNKVTTEQDIEDLGLVVLGATSFVKSKDIKSKKLEENIEILKSKGKK